MQDFVHPPVELALVGENTSTDRSVHSMDGEPMLYFPTFARPLGAAEVCRDFFPGLKEVVVRHQLEPWGIIASHTISIVDRMGPADHSLIVILDWCCAQ